jgi:hypothetical protein
LEHFESPYKKYIKIICLLHGTAVAGVDCCIAQFKLYGLGGVSQDFFIAMQQNSCRRVDFLTY